MAGNRSYNPVVEYRGAAAQTIRSTPELLARFEGCGGIAADLEDIARLAETAKLMNLAQSKAQSASSAITAETLKEVAELEADHSGVMAVLVAVRRDLAKAGAAETLLAAVDKVLANESATILVPADGEQAGKKLKPSASLEARRAEIERDALALINLSDAHAALATRKISLERLRRLAERAKALGGRVAAKKAEKGSKKAATSAEQAAVAELSACWAATYRILRLAAQKEPRIQKLLEKTSSKR